MTFQLGVFLHDGHAVAAVRGELDVTNSADAISVIVAVMAWRQVVIVECSALEFIDCSALGAVLKVQRLARQSGGDLLLAAPSANVLRLLSLTGMDEAFGIHASVDAAVACLAGSADAGPSGRPERAGRSAVGSQALSGSSG